MNDELQEIDGEALAHSVSYVLKRDRKTLQRLESRDDDGHMRAARRIIAHLKLCGVRFFRRPPQWASLHTVAMPKPDKDGGG